MSNEFVHLHVHTEYSLLDGLSKISDMLSHVKENSMDSIGITDHGAMYGVIEFFKKCKEESVKPIIGIELYTTNMDHTKRVERSKIKNYHLLLLAKDNEGYKNLMKLTSIAHLEGYYYRPRVDRETLKKYSKGLICTSACPQGEIAQAILEDDYKKTKKTAEWFLNTFGKDYYLEIQRHEYKNHIKEAKAEEIKQELREMQENEDRINEGVVKLSRDMGIPLVATNDAHYVKKEQATAQDALVCIATAKNVSDIKRLRFIDSPNFYLKTPKEMSELFSDYPDAIKNTVKISERCDVSITLDKWFFPKYKLEKGKTDDEQMEDRIWEGIKKKIDKITPEIKKRLKYEMDIIKEKGYSTYFLIMSDIAIWSKENGIVTNTRGSAAGSLVSYAMDIININPLDYDLPFERFLTPWRPSPPDIDFDIADNRREEIIKYLTDTYGKEKVAQICTFGRMLAKGSVRDVARVLGYPYATGDRISKVIPLGSQGFPMSIERALDISPDLNNMYKTEDDTKKIVDLAQQVEGNARHVSVHAAGLVIAPTDITDYTPVQLDPEGKKVITQYDMNALDPNVSPGNAIGLLKFDLLGLRNLSILGAAVDIVRRTTGKEIDLHKIPLDNKKTYEMLSRGETMGVFQLSGSGITKHLKDLKPERVEDLMAMVALYRPGPMAQIPEYIDRKNNPKKVSFFDPRMEEYLGKSYGLLVYQDDVFATAIKIAGYTWEEADKFRKAVGKKVPKEMEKQKKKFIEGAVENGMEKSKAEELFKLIEPFSGYGFNKAHASSYGMVAYWTAYMKANFTVEFMCALLTAESNDTDKIASAVNECRRMGIDVLLPDINQSEVEFTIVESPGSESKNAIRFGLNAVKNVGKAAIDAILEARVDGVFLSFADFLSRVDARKVNKRVLESLIKVGAMSRFGKRSVLLSNMDELRNKLAKKKNDSNQQGLFSSDEIKKSMKVDVNLNEDEGEELADEEIQNLERELLGFSLSAKPVTEVIELFETSCTHKIEEVLEEEPKREVRVAAVVEEVRVVITRSSGKEMAFAKVRDDTASIDLVIFPNLYKSTREIWVDNNPVLIGGKVDFRDDSPSILVDDVETKEDVENGDNAVYLKIPRNIKTFRLKQLKSLFKQNPGSKKVILIFKENGNRKVQIGMGIGWNKDLAREISDILEAE